MGDNDKFSYSGDEAALAVASNRVDISKFISRQVLREDDKDDDTTSSIQPAKKVKRSHSVDSATIALRVLKQSFGLDRFRLHQEAVISRLLDGGNVVVIFPTGGGKSLCYQVRPKDIDIL
jgi:superfamily II DNA helicase RecQ